MGISDGSGIGPWALVSMAERSRFGFPTVPKASVTRALPVFQQMVCQANMCLVDDDVSSSVAQ